jgi:hypothetical protein
LNFCALRKKQTTLPFGIRGHPVPGSRRQRWALALMAAWSRSLWRGLAAASKRSQRARRPHRPHSSLPSWPCSSQP